MIARPDPFDVRRARRARRPAATRSTRAGVLAPADVHVAAAAVRAGGRSATRRSCSPPRSPSAGRGSGTSASTSRRSATRRRSTPRSRSTCPALPWPEPRRLDRRGRRQPARWRAAAARGQPALPRPLLARGGPAGARSCEAFAAPSRRSTSRGWRTAWRGCSPAGRRRSSSSPPPPRSCGASRSSRAGPAPARRRPWRGSWRCSPSRTPNVPLVALAAPTGSAAAAAAEGGPGGGRDAGRRRADARAAALAARRHPAPPAGQAPALLQPLPPRPRQPAPARRRDRRRDLDGVAVDDGPAGRGGAAAGAR